MITNRIKQYLVVGLMAIAVFACAPEITVKQASPALPGQYAASADTLNTANTNWKTYFNDKHLNALIDTALRNNQELNIVMQEIEMLRNEVQARKGEYLPSLGIAAGGGGDKVGRYTRNGALEANTEIREGEEFPEPLGDVTIGAYASWELDVWRKLRNAKQSAYKRYMASMDGRNFLVTNLVAEVVESYYELLALDNELQIVRRNVRIQSDALEVVKLQKQSARVTELAVKRFEAQVLNTRSLQFDIQQRIIETENRINFLVGRYPQPVARDTLAFEKLPTNSIHIGLPAQLLEKRPDVREVELQLAAANLDIKVARAQFYPSLGISAGLGYQAFKPSLLFATPESALYYMFGDVFAPLLNRKAIKAAYFNANAKQKQAVFNYERTILNAYIEVVNQYNNIQNLQSSYELRQQQVQALTESISISTNLFKSARADYVEVLLTQREALDARFDLIETKVQQLKAKVNIYRALGGGWQ